MEIGIYAINIDHSTNRWSDLSQQACELDLRLQRIAGIDGKDVDKEDRAGWNQQAFRRNTGREMLPGEYGCYRSHLKALSAFLDTGFPVGLIIEDDISLIAGLPARAVAAHQAVPQADVIKLVNHRVVGFRHHATTDYGDRIGRAFHGPMGSTACYLVTRRGAARLLRNIKIIEHPFDIALERGWASGTEVFTVQHDVVRPKRLRSTIADRAAYRANKFPWWRRLPTHCIRGRDYLNRLLYTLQ